MTLIALKDYTKIENITNKKKDPSGFPPTLKLQRTSKNLKGLMS